MTHPAAGRDWESAWQDALYGATGFYRRARPADHFVTSVQGIPHAGRILARAVAALATRHGLTDVVDLGSGRGELLGHLARESPRLGLHGVDVVARPADLPRAARWSTSPGGGRLPDGLRDLDRALVIAHEWLDDVPCPVAEHDGATWREVLVESSGREHRGEPLHGGPLAWAGRHGPPAPRVGDRLEIGAPRDRAYGQLCARVRRGLVVAVDYGHRSRTGPPHGTLTGYRGGRMCPPVPDGSCDITAHVCVDSLGADEAISQRDLLGDLPVGSPAPPRELAHRDPPAYLHALSEHSTWAQLRRPGGLGDFWWAMTAVQ